MLELDIIRIRAYNVGFGDCVLARIPDGQQVRHMLVDFGRAPGKAHDTSGFPAIARDIADFCGGHLDVLVMSHEHLDHIEGFLHQKTVFDKIKVDHVWMSLPSWPDYYETYADARPQKKLRELAEKQLAGAGGLMLGPPLQALLENNLNNADRIDYLRKLKGAQVHYLSRDVHKGPAGLHSGAPFSQGMIEILAPESDVSAYYGGRAKARSLFEGAVRSLEAQGLAMQVPTRAVAAGPAAKASKGAKAAKSRRTQASGTAAATIDRWTFPEVGRVDRPVNMLDGDWRRLREALRHGGVGAARLIDRAQNNTSLAFVVNAGGRRLLFPGDAELESWRMIREKMGSSLGPVDFLKVAHHGSHNGTPVDGLLDVLLPASNRDEAVVVMSTQPDVYGTVNPVPDQDLLAELHDRCRTLHRTDQAGGLFVEVTIPVRRGGAPAPRTKPARKAAAESVDPLSVFLTNRRTGKLGKRGPAGAKPFESGEHIWLGSAGARVACEEVEKGGLFVNPRQFVEIPRKNGNDLLSYGELVALSGDFYGSPDDLYGEKPSVVPWLWEDNDVSDIRKVFDEELAWIEDQQRSAKGNAGYPDRNVRLAWNAKSYVELALGNTDHFGWHNQLAYVRHHTRALELARQAGGQVNDIWTRALFTNAFADHFLTDGFAAGHIRVPRAEIRAWAAERGYSEKLAGALSKVLHDQDGHIATLHAAGESTPPEEGLRVLNAAGHEWLTRCDGQLFLPPGAQAGQAVTIPVSAVAASVKELLLAWKTGVLPEGLFAASRLVPFPHPEGDQLIEKFPANLPQDVFDRLMASVRWFAKIPWVGPGLRAEHVHELLEELPTLMARFRARVRTDLEEQAPSCARLAPRYLAAFRELG